MIPIPGKRNPVEDYLLALRASAAARQAAQQSGGATLPPGPGAPPMQQQGPEPTIPGLDTSAPPGMYPGANTPMPAPVAPPTGLAAGAPPIGLNVPVQQSFGVTPEPTDLPDKRAGGPPVAAGMGGSEANQQSAVTPHSRKPDDEQFETVKQQDGTVAIYKKNPDGTRGDCLKVVAFRRAENQLKKAEQQKHQQAINNVQ